jgi:hypothetical protein
MKNQRTFFLVAAAAILFCCGLAPTRPQKPGVLMTEAAEKLLAALSEEQRALAVVDFDSEKRRKWHFIPMETRKGLELNLTRSEPEKLKLVGALLQEALSKEEIDPKSKDSDDVRKIPYSGGYGKAKAIMQLEAILAELEGDKAKNKRDPYKYYLTIFGKPAKDTKWGLSFEGHHLSLNYVVDKGEVVSSTPSFFGANPAIVKDDYKAGVERGINKGHRVLAKEEELAFEFLESLDDRLFDEAVIAAAAPKDIREAGSPQPPVAKPVGLAADKIDDMKSKDLLRELIRVHANNMPRSVARKRTDDIETHGFFKVRFAWAGATEPGTGHYYRIEGPTFLIEFCNTQPDSAGNPANHIHTVWRDKLDGDFGIPIKAEPKKPPVATKDAKP